MRLFVAILFSEKVKDQLLGEIDRLRRAAERGRFTRRENLHMTLAFLGEVPPTKVPKIRAAMDEIGAHSGALTLKFAGLGRFKGRSGDLIFLGTDGGRALTELQKRLSDALKAAGFTLEDRAFRPHITLGREVRLNPGEKINREAAPLAWDVTAISLMRSERIGGKITYTEMYRKELSGGTDTGGHSGN